MPGMIYREMPSVTVEPPPPPAGVPAVALEQPDVPVDVAPAPAGPVDTTAELVAEAERAPTPWPEGAPTLWPVTKLPRRQRARVKRQLAVVFRKVGDLEGADFEGAREAAESERSVGAVVSAVELDAVADELSAEIEDFLILVTPEPDAVRAWCADADDNTLFTLFKAYTERHQPGEA